MIKDTMHHLGVSGNSRIMKVIGRLLSLEEHENADCLPVVVAGKKVIVVCDNPEPIQEVVLIDEANPKKVYRMDLALKRKKKASKA